MAASIRKAGTEQVQQHGLPRKTLRRIREDAALDQRAQLQPSQVLPDVERLVTGKVGVQPVHPGHEVEEDGEGEPRGEADRALQHEERGGGSAERAT